ncbi:MAG: YraN family protein [Clostridiales bacterium]|nr:YraN family protein [Clostridiales bacterium]
MSNALTGLMGEMRAAAYARKMGMKILKKRYRTAHGEIDLIVLDGDTLVFIEVKARPQGDLGQGIRAVNGEKQRHLRYAAQCFLSLHPARDIRFDVIEISRAGIRHIRDAFS